MGSGQQAVSCVGAHSARLCTLISALSSGALQEPAPSDMPLPSGMCRRSESGGRRQDNTGPGVLNVPSCLWEPMNMAPIGTATRSTACPVPRPRRVPAQSQEDTEPIRAKWNQHLPSLPFRGASAQGQLLATGSGSVDSGQDIHGQSKSFLQGLLRPCSPRKGGEMWGKEDTRLFSGTPASRMQVGANSRGISMPAPYTRTPRVDSGHTSWPHWMCRDPRHSQESGSS